MAVRTMSAIQLRLRHAVSLLETVVVILIVTMVLGGVYRTVATEMESQVRMSAAGQLKDVTEIAREYIQANYDEIIEMPGLMAGMTLSGISVMGEPLSDVRNIYQQGYSVRVKGFTNIAGQRMLSAAVVTTDGESLSVP